jgi:hypothetical protein
MDPSPEKVLGLPSLFLREFVVTLVLLAVVFLFSALLAAPLGEAANPGMSPNPAKAPWYFMGFQELLLHFHPVFAVVVLPSAGAVGLIWVAYLSYDEDPSGIWFISERGRSLALGSMVTALVVTPLWVMADEWVFDLQSSALGISPILLGGVLPFLVLGFGLWGGHRWMRGRRSATRAEAVQATLVFLGTGFVVLTAVGVWFRGPGMALGWAG